MYLPTDASEINNNKWIKSCEKISKSNCIQVQLKKKNQHSTYTFMGHIKMLASNIRSRIGRCSIENE